MNRFVNAITTLKLPFCAFKEHLNSSKAAASVALLFQIFKEQKTHSDKCCAFAEILYFKRIFVNTQVLGGD